MLDEVVSYSSLERVKQLEWLEAFSGLAARSSATDDISRHHHRLDDNISPNFTYLSMSHNLIFDPTVCWNVACVVATCTHSD